MKIFHSLYRWGSLYALIGVFVAALFWEEKLMINSIDHKLLLLGLLSGFYFLIDRWTNSHAENLLVSPYFETHEKQKKTEPLLQSGDHMEKKQL